MEAFVKAYKSAYKTAARVGLGAKLNLKPPTNLVLSIVSDTQIDLSWILGDATRRHRIYISTDNVIFVEKGTVSAGVNTFSATGLTNYTRYYFRVVAYQGTVESLSAFADTFDFVIPFPCKAGLFDFSWNNPTGRLWMFPDGTTSTAERPAKTLVSDSTVYLYSPQFTGNFKLNDNGTNARYVGKLSDLQGKLTYSLDLNDCSLITGSLSDLQGKLTYYLGLYNCPSITGSLSDLQGKLTYYLNLYNCSLITGSLSDLQGKLTDYLNLYNCSLITGSLSDLQGKLVYKLELYNCSLITGVYTPVGSALPTYTYLDNTGISTADMDQTLINYANQAVAINKNNGTFTATGKTRTAASDAAIATLTGKGWSVSGLTKI